MAIVKCSRCGADLYWIEGQTMIQCNYCGSYQAVPAAYMAAHPSGNTKTGKKLPLLVAAAVLAIVFCAAVVLIFLKYTAEPPESVSCGETPDSSEVTVDVGALILQRKYRDAMDSKNSGEILVSLRGFTALGDYRDAKAQADALRTLYQKSLQSGISAGAIGTGQAGQGGYTVGVRNDGSVVAVGYHYYGKIGITDWTNIITVSAGYDCSAGLRADGTVVATGNYGNGQCNVSGWTDIVAVSVGKTSGDKYIIGLKADGTVVAASYDKFGNGLHGACDVSGWTDIIAISTGNSHTVGLKSDGTVVAVGSNAYGQCEVSEWRDIIAISAGSSHTLGLKVDGTVVAVGYNGDGQCDVSDWTDIVAISAGFNHTTGLKSDGTVIAAGLNKYGQCDVSGWTEIVSVSASNSHTVGLRSDGTVVAAGKNDDGRCNVSDWTAIRIP